MREISHSGSLHVFARVVVKFTGVIFQVVIGLICASDVFVVWADEKRLALNGSEPWIDLINQSTEPAILTSAS